MLDAETKEKFYSLARSRLALAEAKYRSASGADKIDAVLHDLERLAFIDIVQGKDLETVLRLTDENWRSFCKTKNKEVDEAPKIKTGPSAGLSSIHYKFAYPDKVESSKIFIRNMYNLIMSQVSVV